MFIPYSITHKEVFVTSVHPPNYVHTSYLSHLFVPPPPYFPHPVPPPTKLLTHILIFPLLPIKGEMVSANATKI